MMLMIDKMLIFCYNNKIPLQSNPSRPKEGDPVVVIDIFRIIAPYLLAILSLYFVVSCVRLILVIKSGRFTEASDKALRIVALLYGIGVSAKFAELGPEFLRWYVGDIGFPVAFMMLLTSIAAKNHDELVANKYSSDLECWQSARHLANVRIVTTIVMFGVSVAYEVFAGFIVARIESAGVQNPGIGSFDWLDVVMYAFGSLVAVVILLLQRKRISLVETYLRSIPEQKQEQPPKQARRKYKKRRVKRGVR